MISGVAGSVKGHPRLYKILTEEFVFGKIKIPEIPFEVSTEAMALARQYTNYQIIVEVVSLMPLTIGQRRDCNYRSIGLDPSKQKIFEGKTTKGVPYKIAIPCLL